SLGTSEMGKQDYLAALVGDLADGRSDALDAGGVRDLAVLDRNVEIDAHEHAFAPEVGLVERAEHDYRPGCAVTTDTIATVRSVIAGRASDQLAHRNRGIDHAVGEAPLIVVPRHHPHQRAVQHL